jgi:hypothetical protein
MLAAAAVAVWRGQEALADRAAAARDQAGLEMARMDRVIEVEAVAVVLPMEMAALAVRAL